MIEASIDGGPLVVDQPAELTIRLTNTGRTVCTNIVFKMSLPAQVFLLKGMDRIEVPRLNPGESVAQIVRVRGRQPGTWDVISPNFSYRDGYGQTRRISDFRAQLRFQVSPVEKIRSALVEAEHYEQIGRWESAWPLYLRAGQVERALICVKKMRRQLIDLGRDREAGDLCRLWAESLDAAGRQAPGYEPIARSLEEVARWFEEAARHYASVRVEKTAMECRDLAARVMQMPCLQIEVIEPGDSPFVMGRSSIIEVRVTNNGYGPARDVVAHVGGDVEIADEYTFGELQVDQTRIWSDARVIPSRSGNAILTVDISFRPFHSDHPRTINVRQAISVVEPGPLEAVRDLRHKGTTVQLHIEKYLAPGASSNEVEIRDSSLVLRAPVVGQAGGESHTTLQDSVVVGRRSQLDAEHPATAPSQKQAPDQTICPNPDCGKPAHSSAQFCMYCGTRLQTS